MVEAFGSTRLEDITKIDVQRFLNTCNTYDSAHEFLIILKNIFNEAIQLELAVKNIAALRYKLPEKIIHPDEHNGDWITTFEGHREFLAQVDDPLLKTACVIGLCFGLRRGEIFGLDWEDVDLDNRRIYVKQTYVYLEGGYKLMSPKTRSSYRYVPISDYAYQYLKNLEHICPAVVCDSRGERMNPATASRHLMDYCRENDLINLTFLNMRHSFATACMNAGLDITKVAKLLGHTTPQMTMKRYLRYKNDDLASEFLALTALNVDKF